MYWNGYVVRIIEGVWNMDKNQLEDRVGLRSGQKTILTQPAGYLKK